MGFVLCERAKKNLLSFRQKHCWKKVLVIGNFLGLMKTGERREIHLWMMVDRECVQMILSPLWAKKPRISLSMKKKCYSFFFSCIHLTKKNLVIVDLAPLFSFTFLKKLNHIIYLKKKEGKKVHFRGGGDTQILKKKCKSFYTTR